MSKAPVIYQPKGAAAEYAQWAVNLYETCPHGCKYCYVPGAMRKKPVDFHQPARPRKNILERLEADAKRITTEKKEIHLCFGCDPYPMQLDGPDVTREAIKILAGHNWSIRILSKSGLFGLRDLDLLSGFHWFGQTLTRTGRRYVWENVPQHYSFQLAALRAAKNLGINTWVSLEPVIHPSETLSLVRLSSDYVREFRVGKLNHLSADRCRAIDREWEPPNWPKFRNDVICLLEILGYQRMAGPHSDEPGRRYYIKRSLMEAK